MVTVKISTPSDFPLLRQVPKDIKIDGEEVRFVLNDKTLIECDYWIVLDGLISIESCQCSELNTFLFTGEPPSVKMYNKKFLNQFAHVASFRKDLRHSSIVKSIPALPWFAGIKYIKEEKRFDNQKYWIYNDFLAGQFNDKKKNIAIISSNKKITKGHKKRVEFINLLKNEFWNEIDIYGNGYKPIPDKLEILKDYKYSIVIENGQYYDYWTEKLADAFLAEAFPIYCGCINILEYFTKDSLSLIDISNSKDAIDEIKRILSENFFSKNYKEILLSKNKIINEYNMFRVICNIISKIGSSKHCKQLVTLKPESLNILNKIQVKLK